MKYTLVIAALLSTSSALRLNSESVTSLAQGDLPMELGGPPPAEKQEAKPEVVKEKVGFFRSREVAKEEKPKSEGLPAELGGGKAKDAPTAELKKADKPYYANTWYSPAQKEMQQGGLPGLTIHDPPHNSWEPSFANNRICNGNNAPCHEYDVWANMHPGSSDTLSNQR